MQAQGVLFGPIAAVFGIVIAGVWSATQWTAAALGYQLRLGSPWFDFFGTPVYHPWRLFEWWFFFDAYAPHVFDIGGAIAGGSGLVAVVVAIAMSVWRSRQARLVTTYGSARWADAKDIRKAGLIQPNGVFLGLHRGQYLRHEGPEHVLTFAPTRSGKGVGLVVPTLLSWPASVVVHDIKGENWALTAGWRSRFSHCLLFNPTDAQSAAYNPLLEVRRGAHEVRDVQNVADILVDPDGALERRNHWEKTSHALLVGAILHVLYAGEDKTLRGVANFLSDPACPFELTLHRMMTTKHLGDAPHPVVASAAREVLNKSDNERSGVLSTAMSFLGLYRDPTVAEVTSRCDWRIADLISAEHPVSLYLVVPPSDISRTKPLIRLILNQIGRRLTESLDGSDGIARRHKLLLMLDFGREREGVDLSKVVLTHHRLKDQGQRNLALHQADGQHKREPMTEAGGGSVQDKQKVLLSELVEKVNDLFEGELSDEDRLVYVNHVKGKLLESEILVQQASNNSKGQFDNSPDLDSALTDAIIDAFDAYTTMSKQALDSERVRAGLKSILLGPAQLYEALRARGGNQPGLHP